MRKKSIIFFLALMIIIWLLYITFPACHDYTFHGLNIHLNTNNPGLHTNSTELLEVMDKSTGKDYYFYYFKNLEEGKNITTEESVIFKVDDGYVIGNTIQYHNKEFYEKEKTQPKQISKENILNITTNGKIVSA